MLPPCTAERRATAPASAMNADTTPPVAASAPEAAGAGDHDAMRITIAGGGSNVPVEPVYRRRHSKPWLRLAIGLIDRALLYDSVVQHNGTSLSKTWSVQPRNSAYLWFLSC